MCERWVKEGGLEGRRKERVCRREKRRNGMKSGGVGEREKGQRRV